VKRSIKKRKSISGLDDLKEIKQEIINQKVLKDFRN